LHRPSVNLKISFYKKKISEYKISMDEAGVYKINSYFYIVIVKIITNIVENLNIKFKNNYIYKIHYNYF